MGLIKLLQVDNKRQIFIAISRKSDIVRKLLTAVYKLSVSNCLLRQTYGLPKIKRYSFWEQLST